MSADSKPSPKLKVLGLLAIFATAIGTFWYVENYHDSHVQEVAAATEASWGLPHMTISEDSWNEMRWGSRHFGDEWSVTLLPDMSGLASRQTAGMSGGDTPPLEYVYRPPHADEWHFIGYHDEARQVSAAAAASAYSSPNLMLWRLGAAAVTLVVSFIAFAKCFEGRPVTESLASLKKAKAEVDDKHAELKADAKKAKPKAKKKTTTRPKKKKEVVVEEAEVVEAEATPVEDSETDKEVLDLEGLQEAIRGQQGK